MKQYLGDSVYADIENGMIKLTTENGYGESNQIFLEYPVYLNLQIYVSKFIEQNNAQKEVQSDSTSN